MPPMGPGERGAGKDRRWTLALLVTLLLVGILLWEDRTSLERANRLYRAGDIDAAVEVYRTRSERPDPGRVAAYNFGTALLPQDPEEAAAQLRLAAREATDPHSALRAHYNLGYRFVSAVGPDTEADSAIALLREAVEHNRRALRLDLEDPDALVNLAIAQRMLDSLTFPTGDVTGVATPGEDETRIDDLALVRSEMGVGESGEEPEQPRATESLGERRGASVGAHEAWTFQDPGPLSEAEARRILAEIEDPPERLVRGLLWSLRPDVAWWTSEGYPGGSW